MDSRVLKVKKKTTNANEIVLTDPNVGTFIAVSETFHISLSNKFLMSPNASRHEIDRWKVRTEF